jgi:exodeoxyribonuclease-3
MTEQIKLVSWNVVSLRNMLDKANLAPAGQQPLPFLEWLKQESPDILCFQETRLQQGQVPASLENPAGYHTSWSFAEKKGYSGTATFSREEPLSRSPGLGIARFDSEGRVMMTEHPGFKLFNIYFPKAYSPREVATARKEGAANADRMAERLPFKLDFYDALLEHADALAGRGENIVICGDFNVAHQEIDLARPRQNRETSGFLPEERAWMDRLIEHGYIDTFRHLHKDPGNYTWWSYRFKARDKDIGWRLDYFFVSKSLAKSLTGAFILKNVLGSDHCPVGITLKIG